MHLTLANPLALWALCAVIAVLAIHFLQRRRRQLIISTLFLLPAAPMESERGSVWTRLRNSRNLWWQLLAALLFAFALAQPTLTPRVALQHVAVILDNRASMEAFADTLKEALRHHLGKIDRTAGQTHWVLLDSSVGARPLYEGSDLSELLRQADEWSPNGLNSDLGRTFAVIRNRLAGTLRPRQIVFSDRPVSVPPGVASIGVGRPADNVGFITYEVMADTDGQPQWRAWIRNYGTSTASREWWVELPSGDASARQPITIEPNRIQTLAGRFPIGVDRLVIALEADVLPQDDRLYLQRPSAPTLAIGYAADDRLAAFFQRLIDSIPAAVRVAPERAHLLLTSRPADAGTTDAIVFMSTADDSSTTPGGTIVQPTVAADHPLVRGLSWDGLLTGPTLIDALAPGDTGLAWRGDAAPLFLRRSGPNRAVSELVINFDLSYSNADRLPAFVALLHRFAEDVRKRLPQPVAANFSTGQPLGLSFTGGAELLELTPSAGVQPGSPRSIPAAAIGALRAPAHPGFFTLTANDVVVASGGVQFGPIDQADLRDCQSWQDFTGFDEVGLTADRRSSTSLVPLLLLALLMALLGAWKTAEDGR